MRIRLLLALLALCASTASAAASGITPDSADSAVVFQFRTGQHLFLGKEYANNGQAIDSLSARILRNRSVIDRGSQKIRVYGFSTPVGTFAEDIQTAKLRSNQVKSYFITRYGLKESDFRTRNQLRPLHNLRNVVVVTCPAPEVEPTPESGATTPPEPVKEPLAPTRETPEPAISLDRSSTTTPATITQATPAAITQAAPAVIATRRISPEHPRNIIALKTNVLLLAATVANLGVEFGFGRHFSIDIPVTYSPYLVSRSFRLQTLTVQPELRYWLTEPLNGHFFGIHGHVGSFNVATNDHTRYQDHKGHSPLWGAGLSYGYALRLARCWGIEFTLGAGYANIRYDSFYNLPNGAQIASETKNYWGLTRAGISIVYRIGQWGTQR